VKECIRAPMPELPEVETIVRALRDVVTGARIDRVVYASRRAALGNRRDWREQLRGRIIEDVERRGKHMIFGLSGEAYLVLHLRMTGRLLLRAPRAGREPHDRLILALGGSRPASLRHLVLVDTRQFARVDFCPPGSLHLHPGLSKLGPEATEISEQQLCRLTARSQRPIKALLLDQRCLAGLGNIYADESLFAAGIHPAARCDLLDRRRLRRLRTAIHRILAAAIAACGTTFDTFSDLSGQAGGFAPRLKVYGRTGEPCRVCGRPIARMVIVGRGTHFCPRCQKI